MHGGELFRAAPWIIYLIGLNAAEARNDDGGSDLSLVWVLWIAALNYLHFAYELHTRMHLSHNLFMEFIRGSLLSTSNYVIKTNKKWTTLAKVI